ncbi:sulfite exporter TauE/SafE family protein [Hyphomicrobium sp.]|uniref:sulfite exporter TauE/SafE family protein n=1 Tax=Hyphomicrobium sp. TaxID=82 RepID=UPI002D7838CE|nr:sulfite exporter TauE/SafE family protein [Hyphomicrobium sp.]HET6387914.1 sulfite exporter TauE/SafE family protein [Hyphomicrobium sp.]
MPEIDLSTFWTSVVAAGFVVGFLVGMTGVGAGSLMTPFLIAKVGISPALAVGTDLLFAAITKATATLPHHNIGNVNWRLVSWLALGSVPGSLGMLAVLHVLDPSLTALAELIQRALIAALVISAISILIYPFVVRRQANVAEPPETKIRRLPTVLLGLTLGSIVTLTSVGAGAIGVVVLTLLYPTLLTRRLIGTDIVHAVPLTLVSGLGHMSIGNTSFELLGLLLVGSIPGIAIGSRLTGVLPDWLLRIALALILCFAAYQLELKL